MVKGWKRTAMLGFGAFMGVIIYDWG